MRHLPNINEVVALVKKAATQDSLTKVASVNLSTDVGKELLAFANQVKEASFDVTFEDVLSLGQQLLRR
jgi:hypothetical protein